MKQKNCKNRHYTKEFKDKAVELVLRGESTLSQVARDLDVSTGNLHRWKQEYLARLDETSSNSDKDGYRPSELLEQNERLRKQVRYIEEQRDILKKALSVLNPPSQPGTNS